MAALAGVVAACLALSGGVIGGRALPTRAHPRVHVVLSSAPRQLDPAARLVDGSAAVRRVLAFPVAFAAASNWLACCIHVAAELRVFDALAYGPRTVAELAADVGADVDALGRLLRALGGQGPIAGVVVEVFDTRLPFEPPFPLPVPPPPPFLRGGDGAEPEQGARRYALTPLGAMLREDGVGSMRPWALFSGQELGRAWGSGLLHAVRTGRPAFGESQGDVPAGAASEFFAYMANNPAAAARFDASMAAVSTYTVETGGAAELYDWSRAGRARTIVDVGGGTGTLLAAILEKHTRLRGTLFDQSHVLEGAPAVLRAAAPGVTERVELAAGSFFDERALPTSADVYVLKNIVHDWPDDEAVRILRAVARAMRPD